MSIRLRKTGKLLQVIFSTSFTGNFYYMPGSYDTENLDSIPIQSIATNGPSLVRPCSFTFSSS